jgi:hypothetical protein
LFTVALFREEIGNVMLVLVAKCAKKPVAVDGSVKVEHVDAREVPLVIVVCSLWFTGHGLVDDASVLYCCM